MRVWPAMWLARIDHKIEQLLRRQTEQERGRHRKPQPPEWIVELGIGVGGPPVQVHRGLCYMAGTRRCHINREEARRLLADGTSACTHCRPDTGPGISGLRAAAVRPGLDWTTRAIRIRRAARTTPGSPTDHLTRTPAEARMRMR
ncbi:DUF6233 domain-containing protein [Streptomyces sp. NPDC001792]|uniref:DUF6233 domain-containing protein n=1 Tax=Streptomyces sp. NPDC001792 TaxID=3154524 RepID=UPI0033257602